MFRNDNKDPLAQLESEIQNVPDTHVTPTKAQLLAVKFNKLRATAARLMMDLKDQHGDFKATSKLIKKRAYVESRAKTVEERRLDRDCDESYLEAVKKEERLEAKIDYVHTLAEVCGNYHIYFRQIGGS